MKRIMPTAMLSRFLVVGLINTGTGYALILLGLHLGLGDYLANAASYAICLTMAYWLHRHWTFAVQAKPSLAEAARFLVAALLAYCANLAVLRLARSLGYIANPYAQAAAMVAYSTSFFVLSRYVVFARARPSAGKAMEAP